MLFTHFMLLAILFLLLDIIWLKSTAKLYKKALGTMLRATPRWIPAILFYVIYISGLMVFALQPAINDRDSLSGLWHGALLGFVAYSTYDLTNFSVLKRWNSFVTLLDILWGTCISGATVVVTYLILGY